MKSSKTFKLSAVATVVLAATNANAALYQVVEVSPSSTSTEYHASAIEASSGSTNCFSSSCGTGSAYDLAGDTLKASEGISFKKEVPFGIDNHFYYQDLGDLESYCYNQLKYSTCEGWANRNWYGDTNSGIGGLRNEREAFYLNSYKSNHSAFLNGSTFSFTPDAGSSAPSSISTPVSGTIDQVVNTIDSDGNLIGNTSSGYYNTGNYVQLYRHRGFFNNGTDTLVLEPEPDTSLTWASDTAEQKLVNQMGRTMAFDSFTYDSKTYVVGSSSVATFNYGDGDKNYGGRSVSTCTSEADPALSANCQNFAFATRAFAWELGTSPLAVASKFSVASWNEPTVDNYSEATAQASVRAAVIADRSGSSYDTLPVLAGFNTDRDGNNMLMQAAVFRPTDTNTATFAVGQNAWTSTRISNATVSINGDYTYSNSTAKAINKNLIVVGEAKLRGDTPENGAAANKMFVADANVDTPTASYFNDMSESIFFSGAGGEVNAINSYNEIVGEVDAETHREVNGKIRKRRGYIYPYDATGSESSRRSVFSNRAWWLDDLTNGGTYNTNNNKYRVVSATGINDAGVISATALKCASGYDSTAHFSYCGGGTETETVVAVKLVPIAGATSADISARASDDGSSVSRSGGGIGLMSIALLGLLGFRRRK
ncbi:DUF3466 family protein [Vibrio hannami]|uniref:DUF3466 family protein n=1 Tax=Vibrio hannami TaxID=2717094 RepID=UPI00240EF37F|nr:DUF3466 family protein [Vibrio hannami]MDG3088096.1 DUF3466 family protein [Vibrio hannami]